MNLNRIKNLFTIGNKKSSKRKHPFFRGKKDVMVNTDIISYKPVRSVVEELKKKIDPVDFEKITFDEKIDDFNLEELSDETKRKIIELIKLDLKERHIKLEEMYGNWIPPEK